MRIVIGSSAFLEGNMEKTMCIEWPAGMVHLGFTTEEEWENCCIEQLKSMRGNSDATLICFRLFKKHLIEVMEMKQSLADPFVYFKSSEDNVVLVAVCHVDDNAIAGAPHWIKWFKEGVKKRFGMTKLGLSKKHLGIWHAWKTDENRERCVVATMPKLVRQIIEVAEKDIGHDLKESSVPTTPGTCVEKNPEEKEPIVETECRSIVGKLPCFATKLHVEGSNPVRELAKFFSNPGSQQWKALERFVGCSKENEDDVKLACRKPKESRIVSSVDSDCATDKGDCRSTSGGLHALGGMMTNWNCATQKSVTLSSSAKAEHVSMAKGLQETLFSQMLLKEIANCELSVVMLEDVTGAIFLVKNQQVGTRTKHIDVRCHFLEHFEKKCFNIKFVRSEDNESDVLTKNAPGRLLKLHAVNVQNGAMNTWTNCSECVDAVSAAWRENVKIDESNESWVEVCHRSSKVKSSLRKAKHGSDGG
jgi:hypothetical protein